MNILEVIMNIPVGNNELAVGKMSIARDNNELCCRKNGKSKDLSLKS